MNIELRYPQFVEIDIQPSFYQSSPLFSSFLKQAEGTYDGILKNAQKVISTDIYMKEGIDPYSSVPSVPAPPVPAPTPTTATAASFAPASGSALAPSNPPSSRPAADEQPKAEDQYADDITNESLSDAIYNIINPTSTVTLNGEISMVIVQGPDITNQFMRPISMREPLGFYNMVHYSLQKDVHRCKARSSQSKFSLVWYSQNTLNLHELAVEMLVKLTNLPTRHHLLASSQLALRAIHIFALGLSGIIKTEMGRKPNELEQNAIRGFYEECFDEDDSKTPGLAFKLGSRNMDHRLSFEASCKKELATKMTISLDDYYRKVKNLGQMNTCSKSKDWKNQAYEMMMKTPLQKDEDDPAVGTKVNAVHCDY